MKEILVVDDEPNIRFLVRVTLESAGYEVARRPMASSRSNA